VDVVTFHDYSPLDGVAAHLARLQQLSSRPLLCSEYMARTIGSTFDPVLGFLRERGVWAFNWGFVRGRSQTYFPWNSWNEPYPADPSPWHHDVSHADGTPYSTTEAAYIRNHSSSPSHQAHRQDVTPLPARLDVHAHAPTAGASNSTASWLAKRAALIHDVFGLGVGVLPNRSVPDHVLTWDEDPGLQGLVWNMTTLFNISSTVFYSPVQPGKRSRSAFFFHHGHSNCVCPAAAHEPPIVAAKCRPGCKSSMPSGHEVGLPGYRCAS
jgi:hypothetical protein